jgi:bifunctional DNA-binding transcriptional regulator/antitoxin component of YhaV-PrlF toxin-antitoxin module
VTGSFVLLLNQSVRVLFSFSSNARFRVLSAVRGSKPYLCVKYESYTCEKMEGQEPEIAVVGTKGQIVIPQRLRRELKIIPKTKLVVYRKGDKLVIARLRVPPLEEELKGLFKEIDEQYAGRKRPAEKEILEEIQAFRREKRAKQGA